MPVLDARHDFMHPVEGERAWSESYYFNCYDPVTDCGFFTRIGVRPNEGTIDVGLSVWLPDGRLAQLGGVREQHEMIDTGLTVGGVTYERIAPMQSWRITAAGDFTARELPSGEQAGTVPVAVDVTFDALMPAIGADGQGRAGAGASVATRQSVGKGHLEQAGRWNGTITVAGTPYPLGDARGNRDKSWGPRTWGGGGSRMWRWFSINLGDDVHFGGIRIGTDAGDLHRGWVWRDGEHASIRDWDVTSELAADRMTHTATHVRATDQHGRVHTLHATLLRNAPHRRRTDDGGGTVLNEGLARWEYEGLAGYGISEYLHTLRSDGTPAVPIA
jgi:hypothetical protein